MAALRKHLQFQSSENDDEMRQHDFEYAYEEDEFGYVEPRNQSVSHSLISQLPSRRLDTLIEDDLQDSSDAKSVLRRRDSHYRTLQLKNATLNSRHQNIDADKIYEILNADPHINDEEKLKTLKEMHQSLTVKRQVKEKLDADWKKRIASHSLGNFVIYKLNILMAFHKLIYQLKNFCYYFEPWHNSLKTIQGQFGSCVASYFIFLRWLLYLNLSNFFITFCFVVIPEIINKNTNSIPSYLGNKTESFEFHNLLTGSGWLLDSLLYFGAYSSQVIQPLKGLPYNMPLAYLCAIAVNMLINLIAVSVSITASYQKKYVDTAGEIKNVFCNKIFSAWDYAIETETAALLQKRAFCNDIKELLYVKRLSERKMTLSQTILQKVSLFFVSLFALAVVMAVGYLTYYLLENKSVKVDIPILQHMTFAITVTTISSFFFYLLKFSNIFEAYLSKKMRLYLTMIRVTALRVVMLGIVVYFWMKVYKPPRNQKTCYEAELGSELYRLILVNFLMAVVLLTFFGEFIRKLVYTFITPRIGLKEFDVAYNILDLVYFQTLAWMGMFCIPLSSLIVVVILIILFYIKKASMSSNCRPPKRSWSINESQTFYLILTFSMFFLAVMTVGYTIFALETSYCGPFKSYENAGDVIQEMFFNDGIPSTVVNFVKYITSPGVLFAIFCALCLAVHYMRAKSNAHISVIKKIRETLILASKDKAFLLQLFDEAFNAHLKNQLASRRDMNSSVRNEDESAARNIEGNSFNQGTIINEAYRNHSDRPLESPIATEFKVNYPPAISKMPQSDRKFKYSPHLKSPICDSPHKGSPCPPHQLGFRHVLLGQNSP